MSAPLVLVTGGSGFVGAHTIVQLLAQGYRVRTTVRSAAREGGVRAMVARGRAALDEARSSDGALPLDEAPSSNRTPPLDEAPSPDRKPPLDEALSFAVADLTRDDGWAEAVAGCEFVLHVASPFPPAAPAHEDELVVPARDGTLRVLRAARDAGVRRTVLTSSFAAVGYSPKPAGVAYTEEDWTDPDEPGIGAYVKSKAIAERAAWEFASREGGSLELAVINPTGIYGPVLGPDYASSIAMVHRLLTGSMPVLPRLFFGVVDVRDVAALHLLAMTNPAAAGQRFLAAAGEQYGMPAMARLLRDRLGPQAARVPTRVLPDWAVRLGARFSPSLRAVAPQVGKRKTISNDKARRVLGWTPRSNEEAVLASARSLLDLGLVAG